MCGAAGRLVVGEQSMSPLALPPTASGAPTIGLSGSLNHWPVIWPQWKAGRRPESIWVHCSGAPHSPGYGKLIRTVLNTVADYTLAQAEPTRGSSDRQDGACLR
jgi:hypothetical protein